MRVVGDVIRFRLIARPDVFFAVVVVDEVENQEGLVAAMMQSRDSWLPAILNAESTVGHAVIDDLVGPLAATMAADYMATLS